MDFGDWGLEDLLASRFYQWLKKTKDLQCQENAKIIQDFCRNRLDNYLSDLKNLFLLRRMKIQ